MLGALWGAIRREVAAYNLEKKRAKEPRPESAPKLLVSEFDDHFEILCEDGRQYSFPKEANTSDADLYF